MVLLRESLGAAIKMIRKKCVYFLYCKIEYIVYDFF